MYPITPAMARVNNAPTLENLRLRGGLALAFTAPDFTTNPGYGNKAASTFRISLFPAARKLVLTLLHIHFPPAEAHPFTFQPQPLLNA